MWRTGESLLILFLRFSFLSLFTFLSSSTYFHSSSGWKISPFSKVESLFPWVSLAKLCVCLANRESKKCKKLFSYTGRNVRANKIYRISMMRGGDSILIFRSRISLFESNSLIPSMILDQFNCASIIQTFIHCSQSMYRLVDKGKYRSTVALSAISRFHPEWVDRFRHNLNDN